MTSNELGSQPWKLYNGVWGHQYPCKKIKSWGLSIWTWLSDKDMYKVVKRETSKGASCELNW